MNRIGVLTGGGDCPGLNAVIRGAVKRCEKEGIEVFGFHDGWKGVLEQEGHWMTPAEVETIHTQGGTVLRTSRTNVFNTEGGPEKVKQSMQALGLSGLIAIGGDDTLGVAHRLTGMGLPVVGVPKTIDNDLTCTDYTFGFDTAANVAMRALDDLHTTTASHSRVMVVEIMGRDTGWIAVQASIAADVNVCVIPEFPLTLEEICQRVADRQKAGKHHSIVALAEASKIKGLDEDLDQLERDAFGNYKYPDRNLGQRLARAIEQKTGIESHSIVLGHLQRSGAPTLFDRILGTRLGIFAAELVVQGAFGQMAALCGTEIVSVPMEQALSERKRVGEDLFRIADMCCR